MKSIIAIIPIITFCILFFCAYNVSAKQKKSFECSPVPSSERMVGIAYSPWFPPINWSNCWGTPELGYYQSDDTKIIRQHADWLSGADVDFIFIDWSNNVDHDPLMKEKTAKNKDGSRYRNDIEEIESATRVVFKTFTQLDKTPKIAIMAGAQSKTDISGGLLQKKVNQIYDTFIANPLYRKLYQTYLGKPLLIIYTGTPSPWHSKPSWNDPRFTVRWLTGFVTDQPALRTKDLISKHGYWSWEERGDQTYTVHNNKPEAMTVSAHWRSQGNKGDKRYIPKQGRENGDTFRKQWDRAVEIGPEIVLVTTWNEWTLGEAESPEMSKDIEPSVEHGHFYLDLLSKMTARFKGTADQSNKAATNKFSKKIKPATVAILYSEKFPSYKLGIDGTVLAKLFRYRGIDCSLVNVDSLNTKGAFNTTNFQAFVNPYGNAIPLVLIEPLKKFRNDGGIFVSLGIPLTHPVVKENGIWKDKGHTDLYISNILNCSFGSVNETTFTPTKLGRRLGISSNLFTQYFDSMQYLDVSRINKKEAIIKPIMIDKSGNLFSALVENINNLKTNIDVYAAADNFKLPIYENESLVDELIVRATAYALFLKGIITKDKFDMISKQPVIDNSIKNIKPVFIKNREARIYPSAGPPPDSLSVLDMEIYPDDPERNLAVSVQGLINGNPRSSNLVYLISGDTDKKWLSYLKEKKFVKKISFLKNLKELVTLTGHKRALICDDNPSHLLNIATTIAGCDKLLIVSDEEIAKKYNLEIVKDLRGKWKTNAKAYKWLIKNYGNVVSKNAVALNTRECEPYLRDYCIANKLFTFWVSGTIDTLYPGANALIEEKIITEILAKKFPVNIPVLGYPWRGHGHGIGEGGGVTMLSRAGKFLIPTDLFHNLSVWTRFAPDVKPIQAKLPKVILDNNKHYASIVISDGDNLCTWQGFFPDYIQKLKKNNFPVGWTLGPTLVDLAPPIFDWIRENLSAGDSVGSGVSGVGYIAIDEYGKAFGDSRQAVMNEFLDLTSEYCKKSGEEWLWLMRYGSPGCANLSNCTKRLKGIKAIMGGYGKVTSDINKGAEIINGVVIFHSLNNGVPLEKLKLEIRDLLTGSPRKMFLHIFILNWNYTPEKLIKLAKWLEKENVELVPPKTLARLYKQERK